MSIIKAITVRLEDELHQQFKIYAVKQNKDMQQILIEYIKKLVEEGNRQDK